MIKCCIFDLDGTLVNSLQDLADAANYALSTLGFPVHNVEKYKQFVGNGVAKLIERVLPANYCTDEYKQKMRTVFNENYNRGCLNFTKPYNDIRETLLELKKRKFILAVVTNKPDDLAKKILNNLLPNIFDGIYGNIISIPTKPAPDLCLRVVENHNIKTCNCVFIGDSDVDMLTATNACMIPIGVTWGFRNRNELETAGAKYIIDKPRELLNMLKTKSI
jgi:phosphoglycolate phosphatase